MAYYSIDPKSNADAIAQYMESLAPSVKQAVLKSPLFKFCTDIFPMIDPEPYKILFSSSGVDSYPVNIMIAFMILADIEMMSYKKLHDRARTDPAVFLALHLFDTPDEVGRGSPPSLSALYQFTQRLVNYSRLTGINLLQNTLNKIAIKAGDLMGVDWSLLRIDTSMIEANIKHLSRPEILYSVIKRYLKTRVKCGLEIPEGMEHYLKPNDHNAIFYHNRKKLSTKERNNQLINDAAKLIELYKNDIPIGENLDWTNLYRAFHEQVIEDKGTFRFRKDASEGLHSAMLQNPTDPDAQFREKNGPHIGYAVGLVAAGSGNASMVVAQTANQNTASDGQFMNELLSQLPKYPDDRHAVMDSDGGFSGQSQIKKAAALNIDVFNTNLIGVKPNPTLAKFDIDPKTHQVNRCPEGIIPSRTAWNADTDRISCSFDRNICENCPLLEQCAPVMGQNTARKSFTLGAYNRAVRAEEMDTKEFAWHACHRNGVEPEFNIHKNVKGANRLPVRGKQRVGIRVTLKFIARNAEKYINSKIAHFPVFTKVAELLAA